MKARNQLSGQKGNHFLRVLAIGRLFYALVLFALGIALFKLIGKNLSLELLRLINQWHLEAHVYYIHWLLQKTSTLSHEFIILLTIANFFYAGLAFVEAAGLVFAQHWAYWLVIVDTASFIPVESYQLCKQFGWINFALLLFYIASVVYLLGKILGNPKRILK